MCPGRLDAVVTWGVISGKLHGRSRSSHGVRRSQQQLRRWPRAFSASRKQALRGHLALRGAAGEKNEIAGGNKDVKVKQTDHKQQDGYKFYAVISVRGKWQ